MFDRAFAKQDALRYALGILVGGFALLLRQALSPLLGHNNPYHVAWLAVVFSAWYCGLGPSILTAVMEAVGVWYWFLEPTGSFRIQDRSQIYGMVGFLIFSGALIAFGESTRRAGASRFRVAAIVDSSDDAIISKSLEGVITSWNKGAEDIFGWTAQEAVGKPLTIIVPPELYHEEQEILRKLRAGERIDHFETVRVSKAGKRLNISVTISPVRDARGRIVGASKIARDITLLKEIEEASRINEERLRAAFSQTYSFLIFLTTDGTIREANRAAVEGCGFSRSDAIGRKFWEIWWGPLEQEQERVKESIARTAKGEIVREECYYCLQDQSVRYADRTLAPVRDIAGNVVMIVASGIDMTEQKTLRDSLEQRVQTRTQEIEQSNASLRQLSARLLQTRDEERRRMARELHDSVGQLLAAISMNISNIELEKDKLTPAAAQCVMDNGQLITKVSREIRTLSHLLHPPLLDEVGLESAIRDFVDGFARRSKIAVDLTMPSDFGRLPGDVEIALFRVVQECLTNIHRHSGSTTASIRIFREDGRVRLEVRDEGKGIPADKLSLVNSYGTVGVGFRGMRERIRQLGGSLNVESNGHGTFVAATLAVQDSKAASAAEGQT
jgi:PAS domain S-box-containing protein